MLVLRKTLIQSSLASSPGYSTCPVYDHQGRQLPRLAALSASLSRAAWRMMIDWHCCPCLCLCNGILLTKAHVWTIPSLYEPCFSPGRRLRSLAYCQHGLSVGATRMPETMPTLWSLFSGIAPGLSYGLVRRRAYDELLLSATSVQVVRQILLPSLLLEARAFSQFPLHTSWRCMPAREGSSDGHRQVGSRICPLLEFAPLHKVDHCGAAADGCCLSASC